MDKKATFVALKSHYQEKSSDLGIKDATNLQMYPGNGLKILNHLLLWYLLFYCFNCSLQCQSFEVWKGLPGLQFCSLNISKWLPAVEPSLISLRFHLAFTRKRLKTITFENGLQREQ